MFHPSFSRPIAVLAVLATAVALVPVTAGASPTGEVEHTKVVQYSDLDTSNPKDVQRLYLRIQRAAREVCRNYQWSPVQLDCYQAAVDEAVAKVNKPLLSALVEHRGQAHRGYRAGV